LPAIALGAEIADIETDDEFILKDYFIKRLEMMPISQTTTAGDAGKLSLLAVNKTAAIQNVCAKSIVGGPPGLCEPNICIVKLHPGKFLRVRKFGIRSGKSGVDGRWFGVLAARYYSYEGGLPVLTSAPSVFNLGYKTYGTIGPLEPLRLAVSELLRRLAVVREGIQVQKTLAVKVEERQDGMVYIGMDGESWTLANLLAKYCYRLDPTIPDVRAYAPYIGEIGTLKIRHPDWKALVIKAIDAASGDLLAIDQKKK
jgi:hypothetical protein